MKNLHDICIWKDTEKCRDCNIKDTLICHFQSKYLLSFVGFFIGSWVR